MESIQSEKAAIEIPSSTMTDPVIDDENQEVEDDIKSIAKSVMSNESIVKSIHSQKSMNILVSKAKERVLTSVKEEEVAMTPPVFIIHTDDDGARLEEMKSLSKLAFKHRNPAS